MWEVVALLVGTDFWDKNTERVHKHESTNRLKNSKTFFHFLVFILFSFILTKRRNSGVDSKKKTFLFLSFFFCSNFLFTIIFYFVELWKHRPNSHKSKSRTETNALAIFFYFFSFCASVLLNTRNFFGSTVFLEIKVVPYRIESHCKIIVERNYILKRGGHHKFYRGSKFPAAPPPTRPFECSVRVDTEYTRPLTGKLLMVTLGRIRIADM